MWLFADEFIPQVVACRVCQRALPNPDALTAEGREYLYFFCGPGCYERWEYLPVATGPQRNG